MDFLPLLLFPLHLSILLLLHTTFALLRFFRILSRLSSRHQSTPSSSSSPSPATDLADRRWEKVPKRLAVILSPVGNGRGRRGKGGIEEVQRLVGWSRELGVLDLTVYDRDGSLSNNVEELVSLLAEQEEEEQPLIVKRDPKYEEIITLVRAGSPPSPSRSEQLVSQDSATNSSDETGSSTLVPSSPSSDSLETSSPKSPSFTLRLISRSAGRPQLAKLARELVSSRLQNPSTKSLSSEEIAQEIDRFPLPEPDLLFVFGGSYLRLSGFPPWQIRLSEMYHYASPNWLRLPQLDYPIFRNALDLYGRAEMRLGR
ncbi:ditrans,polycis-polyprenyl diphosphate synthase [Sporobolomyces salmoneus]|uniref:ditrans,polycis-polyprenyl diphosphate synthase n=1 Tax=Sporobolomyces salmoneus TaxID=183962 RepID=UPI003172E7A4